VLITVLLLEVITFTKEETVALRDIHDGTRNTYIREVGITIATAIIGIGIGIRNIIMIHHLAIGSIVSVVGVDNKTVVVVVAVVAAVAAVVVVAAAVVVAVAP